MQVARGYSLLGDKSRACKTWIQANSLSAQALENRRDIFLDLAQCNDNPSQVLAESLGEKLLATSPDHDGLKAMVQIALRNKSLTKVALYASKLVTTYPEEANATLITAKVLVTANDDGNARDLLLAIVQKASIPEASFLLGKLYLNHKEIAKAAEQFAFATAAYPEASKLRGQCLLEAKDFQGAVTEYENHFAKTGDKESLRMEAKLHRQLGNGMAEKLVLETLVLKGWANEEDKLHLGRLFANFGDSAKAFNIFSDLLKGKTNLPQDSDWSQAALMLGNHMAQAGNCDQAIKLLTTGLRTVPESVPNRAEVWLQVGDCQIEQSRWKDAFESYSQGQAADPHSINLARGQLQAAKKLNEKQSLEKAYRAIYALDTADEDANAFLGMISQNNKDYKQAVNFYRSVASKRPSDARAQENLGNALAMIPELQAASEILQAAIDLGTESDEVYVNRARAYRVEGNKEMATSIIQFLLTRDTANYLATLWMAKFAEEDGNQPLAIELFKKTAKLSAPKTAWPELLSQGLTEAKVSEAQ